VAPPVLSAISGQRYYSPEFGRWARKDPIEEPGFRQLHAGQSALGSEHTPFLNTGGWRLEFRVTLGNGEAFPLWSSRPPGRGMPTYADVKSMFRMDFRQDIVTVVPVLLMFADGRIYRFTSDQQETFLRSRVRGGDMPAPSLDPAYVFVGNAPSASVDPIGLIQTCEYCYCPLVPVIDPCPPWSPTPCGVSTCSSGEDTTPCRRGSLN
jgi:hypothetical protein